MRTSRPDSDPASRPQARRWVPTLATLLTFLFVQTTMFMSETAAAAGTPSLPGTGPCMVTTDQERMVYSATHINWSTTGQQAVSHEVVKDAAQLRGGVAYVNNDLGAIVAKIPGKYLAEGVDYEQAHTPTVIMAVYDPQTSVGTIWVDRTLHLPSGDLLVEQLPFGPADGAALSEHYDGNNPFWQFVPGANGNPAPGNPRAFVKVGANAFYAAVGLVMKQYDAQRGMIATLKVRPVQTVHKSGGLFWSKTTVTQNYYASPKWTLVLPSGAAPGGYTTGYKLPICMPVTGTPLIGSSDSDAQSKASLWSDAATEAGPTSVVQAGQTWAGLTVPSGVEYIDQGDVPVNLDTSEWLAYTHSESHSGLGILSVFIIAVIVSVVTWGAGAAAVGAFGGATAAASITSAAYSLTGLVLTPLETGALAGAAFGATANLIADATGGNSYPGGAGPEFFYGQDSGMGIDANVQSYDLNKYLASLYAVNATNGQTTDANSANPTNPSSGWNGEIGAITQQATVSDQRQAIGSLGTQANKSLAQSSDGATSAPSWAQKQTYLGDTGSTAAGALPPVP